MPTGQVGPVVGDRLAVHQPEQRQPRDPGPAREPQTGGEFRRRLDRPLVVKDLRLAALHSLLAEVLFRRVERSERARDLRGVDDRSPPSATRDEPAPLEQPQRAAHSDPAYPELAGELVLGRQQGVGRGGDDVGPEGVGQH